MKPKMFGLLASFLLFVIFIVLSLVYQSTIYLYIASALPIAIVPFLPDIRTDHFVKANRTDGKVRLIAMENKNGSDTDFLVLLVEPGYLRWNRGRLYFNLADVMQDVYIKPDPMAATITVLKYDLQLHHRKKNWIGISLPQLAQRTEQLSYTTNEINRLLISVSDLQELMQASVKRQAAVGQQHIGA
ncbi:hypothetical protein [Paenibacillus ferrarius]|uniref:hypothetical protein n=1 Tax=Paenibacillus ferrarius TaxID=1469647 RepID=UPI003D2E23C6